MVIIWFLLLCIPFISSYVQVNAKMKSFTHAQKDGQCEANKEIVLFERNTNIPGVVTEQWFTGTGCFAGDSIIRYYIDDEHDPSIEGELFMMHGIGFYNSALAKVWGHKWMGHLAKDGGLYNTFRIPYQKNIRVTLEAKVRNLFWFILRGVENYPVIIGDLSLPPNAHLRLQKIQKQHVPVFQYVTLATSEKSGGLLFMAGLAGESSDFNYLEGCYRAVLANDSNVQYLSSGTEDFFLSAYYYNKGIYHNEHAGLSYFEYPGKMSAYKIFASDPILFTDNFKLVWRQSEKNDNNCYRQTCVLHDDNTMTCKDTEVVEGYRRYVEEAKLKEIMQASDPDFALTTITSYVWFYEW